MGVLNDVYNQTRLHSNGKNECVESKPVVVGAVVPPTMAKYLNRLIDEGADFPQFKHMLEYTECGNAKLPDGPPLQSGKETFPDIEVLEKE